MSLLPQVCFEATKKELLTVACIVIETAHSSGRLTPWSSVFPIQRFITVVWVYFYSESVFTMGNMQGTDNMAGPVINVGLCLNMGSHKCCGLFGGSLDSRLEVFE